MKIKPRHFPYPVLSYFSEDFIDSKFDSYFSIRRTGNTFSLDVTFQLENETLQQLLEEQKAVFSVHVECGKTRYREIFLFSSFHHTITIPSGDLEGPVQICTFILANDFLPAYSNLQFHSDFDNASFELFKGDILAIALEKNFTAEQQIDPLKAISSIFKIIPDRTLQAPPLDFHTDEKIVIRLSKENYQKFHRLAKSSPEFPQVLSSMVIFPTMIGVLEMLNASNGDFSEFGDKRWFRVIDKKLKDLGHDLASGNALSDLCPLALALLGNPLSASFDYFDNMMGETV